jgi:hypothetical protein
VVKDLPAQSPVSLHNVVKGFPAWSPVFLHNVVKGLPAWSPVFRHNVVEQGAGEQCERPVGCAEFPSVR